VTKFAAYVARILLCVKAVNLWKKILCEGKLLLRAFFARSPDRSTVLFHYYLLGGDTAAPSGLFARLCHAFLVGKILQEHSDELGVTNSHRKGWAWWRMQMAARGNVAVLMVGGVCCCPNIDGVITCPSTLLFLTAELRLTSTTTMTSSWIPISPVFENTYFTFFQIAKNVTFRVFWKDVSKRRKKWLAKV